MFNRYPVSSIHSRESRKSTRYSYSLDFIAGTSIARRAAYGFSSGSILKLETHKVGYTQREVY